LDGGADPERIAPPGVLATIPELLEFTDRWLANRRLSELTRLAYRRDLEGYLTWCESTGLRPLEARFTHVNKFARNIEAAGLSPSTVARRLSSVSSWYTFLVRLEAVATNPVGGADRPRVDRDDTTTVGFSAAEAAAIVAAARADEPLGPLCATALAETMVALGARVTELCLARLEDLGYADGHRVLRLERMKGGRRRTRPLPPAAVAAIDAMLEARPGRDDPAAPLFVDSSGRPLDRHAVYRFVRRAARAAGIPSAAKITPHSFRHAWATTARVAGASLEARQHALGHKDPRTTQGYDRAKLTLDTDPAYLVAAAVAEAGARVREDGSHA
jgi:site-specific recombinase XerD